MKYTVLTEQIINKPDGLPYNFYFVCRAWL